MKNDCPFCKAEFPKEPNVKVVEVEEYDDNCYAVECLNCGFRTPGRYSHEYALETWTEICHEASGYTELRVELEALKVAAEEFVHFVQDMIGDHKSMKKLTDVLGTVKIKLKKYK